VRNTQRSDSDLDILIKFAETPTLFEVIELQHTLSHLLGVPIALAIESALKPAIAPHILAEVVRL
jgi:hypothetical protein